MLFRQGSQGLGNHSYCRSPNNCDVPWCFTDDPIVPWEECDVPKCSLETDAPPAITELFKNTVFWTTPPETVASTVQELDQLAAQSTLSGLVFESLHFFLFVLVPY